MAHTHMGTTCTVGNHSVFVTNAILASHVEVEDWVFLSGHTAVHQFCRIGTVSMIGGVTAVIQDGPPS